MTKNGSGTGEPLVASRKGKPKPKDADVFLSPDERKDTEAIAITSASYAAYRVIATTEANRDTPDLLSMIRRLNTRSAAVIGGDMAEAEAMLMSQATALQSLFARLVERAVMQEHMPNLESFMRMALRAQSQCRATLETLATIKNPPIIYARQANVTTGPQQVNNGIAAPSQAGKIENEQTQLLEDNHGEWMDTRATCSASSTDQTMAAVGKINRAEDRGR